MKTELFLLSALLPAVLEAQMTVTVSTGPSNTVQTYYSLQNGEQGSASLGDWDLAFEINGFTSSILVNTANGLTAFETPAAVSEWAGVNSPDEANWTRIHNAETYWSAGALTNGNNLSEPDGFNVGWGTYNIITHTIVGNKIYVIGFPDATYKKLRINSLAGGTYNFTYADLDGGNEQTATLVKSNYAGKNFGYFSFAEGTRDLEPLAEDWDLVFTKYTSIIPSPEPTAYPVAGVLQNKRVDALQVDGVDPGMADWNSAPFDSSMNIIGYDWKTFNMETFEYEYPADRTYFVQDRSGNIWKLVFTAYGGSANGDMTFTQELVSAVGIGEQAEAMPLVVHPNPVVGGQLNIVLDRAVRNGRLSVLDVGGRLVQEQLVTGDGGLGLLPVDVSLLGSGLYVIRLEAEKTTFSARFVID